MSRSMELTWYGHSGCTAFARKVAGALNGIDWAQSAGAFVIRLDGTLGAGKTFFTQRLAMEIGAEEGDVTSPTFVIIQSYATTPRIYHLDLYRVSDDDEFLELGIEEILDEDRLVLIEWGAKFEHMLPQDHISIDIQVLNHDDRQVTITSHGMRSDSFLEGLGE